MWAIYLVSIPNISLIYNFSLILVYMYMYMYSIYLVFTFDFINLSTLSKIFNKHSMHNRFTWVFLLLVLAGTPPFLLFFSKVFFFSMLISVKAWSLVFVLLTTNIILFYIYLQNLLFLKKTHNFSFVKIQITKPRHATLYFIQLVYVYLNTTALWFFPLILGSMFLFL